MRPVLQPDVHRPSARTSQVPATHWTVSAFKGGHRHVVHALGFRSLVAVDSECQRRQTGASAPTVPPTCSTAVWKKRPWHGLDTPCAAEQPANATGWCSRRANAGNQEELPGECNRLYKSQWPPTVFATSRANNRSNNHGGGKDGRGRKGGRGRGRQDREELFATRSDRHLTYTRKYCVWTRNAPQCWHNYATQGTREGASSMPSSRDTARYSARRRRANACAGTRTVRCW